MSKETPPLKRPRLDAPTPEKRTATISEFFHKVQPWCDLCQKAGHCAMDKHCEFSDQFSVVG